MTSSGTALSIDDRFLFPRCRSGWKQKDRRAAGLLMLPG